MLDPLFKTKEADYFVGGMPYESAQKLGQNLLPTSSDFAWLQVVSYLLIHLYHVPFILDFLIQLHPFWSGNLYLGLVL